MRGKRVAPRDMLIALLREAPAARTPPVSKGFKDIATVVQGSREGRATTLRMDTWAWPHARWNLSGSKLMVASPPAIVARWLANRRLHKPGVWPPEVAVEGEPFFAALAERGAGTSLSRSELIYGEPAF